MIRFIIETHEVDNNIGQNERYYHTIDLDVPELEAQLKIGGSGPQGFLRAKVIGLEILDD